MGKGATVVAGWGDPVDFIKVKVKKTEPAFDGCQYVTVDVSHPICPPICQIIHPYLYHLRSDHINASVAETLSLQPSERPSAQPVICAAWNRPVILERATRSRGSLCR